MGDEEREGMLRPKLRAGASRAAQAHHEMRACASARVNCARFWLDGGMC